MVRYVSVVKTVVDKNKWNNAIIFQKMFAKPLYTSYILKTKIYRKKITE